MCFSVCAFSFNTNFKTTKLSEDVLVLGCLRPLLERINTLAYKVDSEGNN